jgi:hypothetical protein
VMVSQARFTVPQPARQGHIHPSDAAAQESMTARMRAAESLTPAAGVSRLPQARHATPSITSGVAKVVALTFADSRQIAPLSISGSTSQAPDWRLPDCRGSLANPRLQTGLVALNMLSKNASVQALGLFAQLGSLIGTNLPDASFELKPPGLPGKPAISLSKWSVTNGTASQVSAQQKHRRATAASLLGLPNPLPRDFVLEPSQGEAMEISVTGSNAIEAPAVNTAPPVEVAANPLNLDVRFRLASPDLRTHSVILTFTPTPGDAPSGAQLAQVRPRRKSAASCVTQPRPRDLQGADPFAALDEIPQPTLA